MRCRKAEFLISDYVDGSLGPADAARLEAHLATCADCRSVLADLRALVRGAGTIETPDVPAEAWSRIRARLREAGAPAYRDERALFGRPRLAPALAALALTAVVVGGTFVGLKLGRGPAALSPEERERATLAKLDEAERYYELAVKSLGEAVAARSGRLSPQVTEMFAGNLEVVDMSIQACREAVRNEPDNVKAREFLMSAYRDKVVLLDDLLDMNRRAARGEVPGEAL